MSIRLLNQHKSLVTTITILLLLFFPSSAQSSDPRARASSLISSGQNGQAIPYIRKAWGRFSFVSLPAENAPARIQKIKMNKTGKGLDGFRFRTPPGSPRRLVWFFSLATNEHAPMSWFLLPRTGRPEGLFKNFNPYNDVKLRDQKLPSFNYSVLQESAQALKPNTEYVVWFNTGSKQSYTLYLSARLIQEDKYKASGGGARAISHFLKLQSDS